MGQNFSWLERLVTNLNNNEQDDNEQETSEMQFEDHALKSNARAFSSRSKAKAKPQRRISASSSTKTIPLGESTWTDIEPQDYSSIDYSVSKKLINLLRHGSLPREDDGVIEFWRFKDYLRNDFVHSQHWSDEKWKSIMAKGGGNKRIFQYCTDPSGKILYFRALQVHSGRSLIEELEKVDASEIQSKRLNAKEMTKKKESRWTNKTFGGDQDLRTSTLVRHRPIQGESNI